MAGSSQEEESVYRERNRMDEKVRSVSQPAELPMTQVIHIS